MALQYSFEIILLVLGRLPNNWESRRAHHVHITDLGLYRTLCYCRSAKQRARQITDAAYYNHLKQDDPRFDTLIDKLRYEFHDDGDKFLTWLQSEHKDLYDRFY